MSPGPPAPTQLREIVLHIGSGKTGTTSIQDFLHQNRDLLSQLGYLYPGAPGRHRHYRLSLSVQSDSVLQRLPTWRGERSRFASADSFRREFHHQLMREINKAAKPNVLLSDEALYGLPSQALQRLHRLLGQIGSKSLRVIVYLRRQDDHLASRYQQVVKVGETRRLIDRVRQSRLKGTYDYYSRLCLWHERIAPTTFKVRQFERNSFVEGSLILDFLEAAGLDNKCFHLNNVRERNESLNAESIEFLRIINLYRAEKAGPARVPSNRDIARRIVDTAAPTLTLPPLLLEEFMAQWEESNQRVAAEFLDTPSGQLFHMPRKVENTTAVQRLEPERLDHFLTLAEIPNEAYSPLRRIVEREARTSSGPLTQNATRGQYAACGWPPRKGSSKESFASIRPLATPVEVVLHIGMRKTGTSSIQSFLRNNRDQLRVHGYLYPFTPGQARHTSLSLSVKSRLELENSPEWWREKKSDPVKFREHFARRLIGEVEKTSVSNVLLSDEDLYRASDLALQRLRSLMNRIAGRLRIVVYLRRQDDHAISLYQEMVKKGEIRRLDTWIQQDLSRIYDYDTRLKRIADVLTPEGVIVRRFEPEIFAAGSLHSDFLEAAGVPSGDSDWLVGGNSNESLDSESVEFLRLLNIYRIQNEAAATGLIDNRRFSKRLTELASGPVLSLPGQTLDTFMKQWENPNRAVARSFCEAPDDELFHTPRKTDNITTSQQLDPTRLGYFLDLLQIPEQVRPALYALLDHSASNR